MIRIAHPTERYDCASGGGALLYDKNRPSDRALYDCASGGEPCRMKSESDLRRNARCGRAPTERRQRSGRGESVFLSKPAPENVIIMFPNVSNA